MTEVERTDRPAGPETRSEPNQPGQGRDATGEHVAGGLDRAAALAAGPSKIPSKVVVIFLLSIAALGLGGGVLDHFFPGPVGTSTTTTLPGSYPPPLQSAPAEADEGTAAAAAPQSPQLHASPSALMDLQRLHAAEAPGFSFTDQDGRVVSLASLRGKVVVLSFFDAACDDICPILEAELLQAYADLGPLAPRVAVIAVNTDPLDLSISSARPPEAARRAHWPATWYFLTGPLSRLNSVWGSYGITIDVQRDTGIVSHNDFLYFIDPSGRLRVRATPFANESTSGVYSLPEVTEAAWAAGIADQATALLPARH